MNLLSRARIDARRKAVKEGSGPLYDAFHRILLKHNPIGLDLERGDMRDD
jgi:hypothetical protein